MTQFTSSKSTIPLPTHRFCVFIFINDCFDDFKAVCGMLFRGGCAENCDVENNCANFIK